MPAANGSPALWPSERGGRIDRDALGLGAGLDFHSLRRSYVTHLIEDGWVGFSLTVTVRWRRNAARPCRVPELGCRR
jgi:hypothetical protein